MSGFNRLWADYLLNESLKDEFKFDPALKCENKFDEYTVDTVGIENLLTEAELILLTESRERKFRENFYDKFADLYMADKKWAEIGKDPKEKYPTEVRVNVGTILITLIDNHPPKAQNKYLTDMGKMLINTFHDYPGGAAHLIRWAGDIVAAVNDFHRYRQTMKRKSLSDYKTLDSLKKALYTDLKLPRIMKARAVRQKHKAQDRFADVFDKDSHSVVYEDDQFFVVRPFRVESSCYFGNKTNWCITKEGNKYFVKIIIQ